MVLIDDTVFKLFTAGKREKVYYNHVFRHLIIINFFIKII